jgi:hypothetical protein
VRQTNKRRKEMKNMKINEMSAVWKATKGEGLELRILEPILEAKVGYGLTLRAKAGHESFILINDRKELRNFQTIEALTKAMESITGGKINISMQVNVYYD